MAGTNLFAPKAGGTSGEEVALTDTTGNAILARGATVPTDTASGYAKGCLWFDTDAAATSVLYCNEGSASSCDFNVINPAASTATAYDDIGNPDASGSIQFAAYTGTYTSTTANWGGLIISNTHAAPTAGASLLNLDYTADGDANGVFIDCTDNAGADSKFLVGLNGATVIAGTATGTDALTLTAGDITLTDGDLTLTTGTITLTAGGLDVDSDNVKITLGDAGATDSYIHFDGIGNLVFFDSNVAGERTLSQLLAPGLTNPTVTGDMIITDGKITWTDGTDEVAGTWTFANTASNDIAWASSVTSGNALSITANSMTSGSMIYLESSAAGMAGEYIRCYDGAADDFVVGANGAVVITGAAAGTAALTMTTGDLVISDTDSTTITSVNGTGSIVEIISGGDLAADKAVLEIDAAGTLDADGSLLRLSAEGVTATNNPYAMQIDCAALDMGSLNVVSASATLSGVVVTNTGALAADKASVEIVNNVSACNADSAVLRLEQGHTTGVATCLALKQDDVDIPFITLETTVGVGNAIEEVAAKNLTVTHFAMVDIEGVGIRYVQLGTIA